MYTYPPSPQVHSVGIYIRMYIPRTKQSVEAIMSLVPQLRDMNRLNMNHVQNMMPDINKTKGVKQACITSYTYSNAMHIRLFHLLHIRAGIQSLECC